MCEYCNDGAFATIIENKIDEYATNVWGNIHIWEEPMEIDMSVVFEIRCGHGYIRLGDRSEMQCIDHGKNMLVNFCPMCGRDLKGESE